MIMSFKNITALIMVIFISGCDFGGSYVVHSKWTDMYRKAIIPLHKAEMYEPSATNKSPIRAYTTAYSYLKVLDRGELVEDGSAITGMRGSESTIEVAKKDTWTIYNKLGTGFFHEVVFTNIPVEVKELDLRISFPEMTLPDGTRKSRIRRPISMDRHGGVYRWSFEYYFDFEYETTPGDWEFKIYSGHELVYKSVFTVENKNKKKAHHTPTLPTEKRATHSAKRGLSLMASYPPMVTRQSAS